MKDYPTFVMYVVCLDMWMEGLIDGNDEREWRYGPGLRGGQKKTGQRSEGEFFRQGSGGGGNGDSWDRGDLGRRQTKSSTENSVANLEGNGSLKEQENMLKSCRLNNKFGMSNLKSQACGLVEYSANKGSKAHFLLGGPINDTSNYPCCKKSGPRKNNESTSKGGLLPATHICSKSYDPREEETEDSAVSRKSAPCLQAENYEPQMS